MAQVSYSLSVKDAHGHICLVETRVRGVKKGPIELVMPAWAPGSYIIRDYAKNVITFEAKDAKGRALTWKKRTKGRWRVDARGGDVVATYSIYANELNVRSSHIDASHGFFTGSSIFMYVEGLRSEPVEVSVKPLKGWKVATGLKKVRNGVYWAKDYDELIDCPIEMSDFDEASFTVRGVKHRIVACGCGEYDMKRLVTDSKKFIEEVVRLFGEIPYKEYTFIIHFTDAGGGGLEHRNSTACNIPRYLFHTKKDYHRVIGLLTHEFFHTWNVKRIMPEAYLNYDLENETYSKLLWLMEGFTSYYDVIAPCRAGLYDPKRVFEMLGDSVKTYLRTPGRCLENLEDSSFDTWIKFYKPDENTPNVSINYYNKGELVGLAMDMQIRAATKNKKCLDDVMKYLWKDYGAKGRGIGEDAMQGIVESVTGVDMQAFFGSYVRGTKDIPFGSFLKTAGLNIKPEKKKEDDEGKGQLGIETRTSGDHVFVKNVYSEGPSHGAGIYANDELLAINGFKVDAEGFKKREKALVPKKKARVSLFRRGELVSVEVLVGEAPPEKYLIEKVKRPTRLQKAVYESWLKQKWKEKKKKK
jgi:predicted metalloprotease with PDZ domain